MADIEEYEHLVACSIKFNGYPTYLGTSYLGMSADPEADRLHV